MVVKVKEPTETEYGISAQGLVLFTYLHLAPLTELTDALLEKKVLGIAYETVRDRAGALPLLTPMSEVAGPDDRAGGRHLSGKGARRTRRPAGRRPRYAARATYASSAAASWARTRPRSRSAWARTSPWSISNLNRLRELDDIFSGRATTLASNSYNVERAVCDADLVIGGVLIPGAAAAQDRDQGHGRQR